MTLSALALAGVFLDRASRKIAKLRAEERVRPLASVGRMAAAILHPQQLLLAFIEFVIADGGDLEPHHRQRFDRRLIVKQRRQEGAGADQVAGCDKNRVFGARAELLDQCRHLLGAAGLHRDLFALVGGIGDPDPARRRLKVAVEIVDRQNSQFNRRGLRFGARAGLKRHRQHQGCEELAKRMSHEGTIGGSTTISRKASLTPSACAKQTP